MADIFVLILLCDVAVAFVPLVTDIKNLYQDMSIGRLKTCLAVGKAEIIVAILMLVPGSIV